MNLWQHQTDALEFLNNRKFGLLLHQVATGKTRTALEFIRQKGFHRILIIGTKNSIDTWKTQADKFKYPYIVQVFRDGLVRNRAKEVLEFNNKFHEFPRITVMNYEAFSRKVMLDTLCKLQFDCIVFDEVHRLRGHATRQSKAAYALARALPSAYRLGLTGTLIYNKPLDVFGIMRFIDPNLFGVFWGKFKVRYAFWKGQFNQIPVAYTNLDEMKTKIQSVSHIIDRRKVLDLPSEQHLILDAEFTPQEKKEYKYFSREFVLLLNEYRNKNIAATNILDMTLKLQQMTGGFIYHADETNHFSNSKRSALSELLDEIESSVVVFYKFKAEKAIISEVCREAGKPVYFLDGSVSEYDKWLSFSGDAVLCVQISSGAEGIDLTKASITVFYDLPYSYGQYEQALGRTSRPNQKAKSILYYYLIVRDSIDEKIYSALNHRKDLIEELVS